MEKHFVTFYFPGLLFSESTSQPMPSWDVTAAKKLAKDIQKKDGYAPFGFQFTTRSRGEEDLDSKVSKTSPFYYLGGKVETAEGVFARATEADKILVSNSKINKFKRLITNTNCGRITRDLDDGDVVLEWS